MSKAEELAEKVYPEGDTYIFGDASIACQVAYVKGYHQAEKDLELTWDDISKLNCLLNEVEHEFKEGMYEDKTYKGYCQEVLKRFNKERKEK